MLQNALISLLYDLANRFPLFPPHRNCKIWAEIHLHNVQLDQLEMIVSTHESLLDTPLSVVVVIPSIIILCYVTASSARVLSFSHPRSASRSSLLAQSGL